MTKIVAFLPAKGTSSRIENKNTKLFDGKELFMHTLQKLMACDFIDEVYLDSESKDIFKIASEIPCKKLVRNSSLANNKTDGNVLFMNEVNNVNADIYIQILCTSPFIEIETIKKGVEILKKNKKNDSVVLVKRDKLYTWGEEGPNYNKKRIPNSKDLPDTIIETMGLYIIRKDAAKKSKGRIGESPYLLKASPLEAIDVNYPDDFKLAELIQAGKREKESKFLENIKNHLSSAMLSDILDDLGTRGLIKGLKPNFPIKIFGRAKTLKLRKIRKGESYEGIYDALKSYETIVNNDIIVVENATPDFAYFGEMNANLAIRSGAAGAIIGGKTRDSMEVKKLNFPVFSSGTTCRDVRKRAVVESMNKKIKLEKISIQEGDLIFGDSEGIIVIPRKLEAKVFEKSFDVINTEKNILSDIANNLSPEEIIKKNGFF